MRMRHYSNRNLLMRCLRTILHSGVSLLSSVPVPVFVFCPGGASKDAYTSCSSGGCSCFHRFAAVPSAALLDTHLSLIRPVELGVREGVQIFRFLPMGLLQLGGGIAVGVPRFKVAIFLPPSVLDQNEFSYEPFLVAVDHELVNELYDVYLSHLALD